MNIEVSEASDGDQPILENLAQLYQYDFSEFDDWDVETDGKFHNIPLREFLDKAIHRSFIIRVDGNIAGFALVCQENALRNANERIWWLHDFFVMRKYRHGKIGEQVACELFDRLGGTWEVAQIPTNVSALAFWRKVINRYTNDNYEEFEVNDDRWHGPVQYFRARTNEK